MSETLVHVASGKVRELFTIDDERLLLVASDRISTFDVVLPTEIPDKGRVLTGPVGVLVRADARPRREPPARACAPTGARPSAGGWRCCRSSASSAATSPARAGRTTSGRARPPGTRCRRGCASRTGCPRPIFTPSTKATTGHDENIDAEQAAALVGEERYARGRANGARALPVRLGARGRARDPDRRHEVRVRARRRTALSSSPTRRSRPTRLASGPPTSTSPAGRSRRSTSSSSATTASRSAGTRRRPAPSCRRTSSPARARATSRRSSA